jgi:cytochrome c-type biogenesis protein CcmE
VSTRLAPKHQRLALVVVAMVALLGAALLAVWSLRNQASYFFVPSELIAENPAPDRAVRLGGMVLEDSINVAEDGVTVGFVVHDGEQQVNVVYRGIVPDLFTEGSGVTVDGHLGADGVFVADNLLAKHDENYVPRELHDMTEAQRREVVAETQ